MTIIPDSLREITATLSRNKLRTFLTGFAVAWGVILLVILLSAGEGFRNGFTHSMATQGGDVMSKTIRVSLYYTDRPYKGYKQWRRVRVAYPEIIRLAEEHKDIVEEFSCTTYTSDSATISYQDRTAGESGEINGTTPGLLVVEGKLMQAGRFLNEADMRNKRKSIVLDEVVARQLFDSEEAAVGKTVTCLGGSYTVVGVLRSTEGMNWTSSYIPLTTAQQIFQGPYSQYIRRFSFYCPKLRSTKEGQDFADQLERKLKARLDVHPEDRNAIYVRNGLKSSEMTRNVFLGIDIFLWLIGFSTLLIGLIGVANIMRVTVAERSKEIGVRKALGAKPRDIMKMVLRESILITFIAGCIGIVLGVAAMAAFSAYMAKTGAGSMDLMGQTITMFRDPLIGFPVAVSIVVLMVVCGVVAGYMPARRAVKVSAIEAMRK